MQSERQPARNGDFYCILLNIILLWGGFVKADMGMFLTFYWFENIFLWFGKAAPGNLLRLIVRSFAFALLGVKLPAAAAWNIFEVWRPKFAVTARLVSTVPRVGTVLEAE